ncbi:MAG TPA: hypothetical protein VEJ88_05045 [Dissulfurispiraceae bacterium]|nr:hypothetical protein [Dissulfurispiraceae bacterium]
MLSTAINPEWEEAIKELIARYGLEADSENVIITFSGPGGRIKRCHILKRPFIRIVYPDRHYVDYPLGDVIEATVRFPEVLLSEALRLVYDERGVNDHEPEDNERKEFSEQ